MTNQEARAVFNEVIAGSKDPEVVARLELAREFFLNPAFRSAVQQIVWEINQEANS